MVAIKPDNLKVKSKQVRRHRKTRKRHELMFRYVTSKKVETGAQVSVRHGKGKRKLKHRFQYVIRNEKEN